MAIVKTVTKGKSKLTSWYENRVGLTNPSPCSSFPQPVAPSTYSNTTFTIQTVRNEKSSRPKPIGTELWFQPTAQPEQYTTFWKSGENTFEGIPGYNHCPATGVWTEYPYWNATNDLLTFYPDESFAQSPEEDWALKMRRKILAENVSLGQSLVEYRQTAKMFGEFGRAVRDGWRLMHGKLSKRDRRRIHPCTIASAYLMNSYGIQPLAADLFDSYEALRLKLELPLIKRFHVRTTDEDRAFASQSNYDAESVVNVSREYIVYAEFDPDATIFALGNPLELAWEVIPYSFVVDWAIPIGKTLAALDVLKDVKRWAGTVTTKTKVEYWYRSIYTDRHGYSAVAQIPGQYKQFRHKRDVLTSIPLPRLPSWKPSQSYKAVLNGVALLASVNKRCKNRKYPWLNK